MRDTPQRPEAAAVGGDARAAHDAPIPAVEDLLARMTLIEKAGQMSQLPLFLVETPDETFEAVRAGRVGSFLNAQSVEQRNELQKVAVEESRLGIPLLFGRDVIHGYKTVFPIPLGQAATFDPDLVERAAAVAAREAREGGVDWTFAPMVDVTRDPRWGRVAESWGEDALLAARMGAAMVRGFQGDDPSAPDRVAACAKHFAAYGAVEAGREYNTTWVPEALLREVYLPPFRACVDAGVLTLMTGFNDLNGVPPSGNELLLRRILRQEWGFRGLVVSDWASVLELVPHGIAEDETDAALQAVRAGVDMEMMTGAFITGLPTLVAQGRLSLAPIDEAVRRILALKHRLGLFERPFTQRPSRSVALCDAHLAVAREAARASLVLLKNEGRLLPLSERTRSIAVVGPHADAPFDQLGCWVFDCETAASQTPLAALRARAGERIEIHEARGVPDGRSLDRGGLDEAVAVARRAEVVIAFVGEGSNLSGEARSRAFLHLPGLQMELIERLAQTGRPLVVVFFAGRPLTIGDPCALAQAAIYAWHPGTMAGPAIVDVLFGDAAPSGKLPMSFPRAVGQVPIYYNAKRTGRPALPRARGVPPGTPLDPEGFDSSYLDVEVTPEFPFGFGLSYTTFAYSDLRVTPESARVGEPVQVSFRVANRGEAAGVEVVQLYVRDRVASMTRPGRELRRFERVPLRPGEAREVTFTLGREDFAFIGRDMLPVVEPGAFDVFVGGDSRADLAATVVLA